MWFILLPQQQPIMKATYECICKYAICIGRRHGSPFSNRIICTFEYVYLSCVSMRRSHMFQKVEYGLPAKI